MASTMSRSFYLIRFDDICPEMNWDTWNIIEPMLDRFNVAPILAVIPHNKDPSLMVAPPAMDFWDRVRAWQKKGWAIGMHGYNHVYETISRGIVGIADRSEFAGLPLERQQAKIAAGASVFFRERVTPDCWIAPSHSFDANTVVVLKDIGINVISDGFSILPYKDINGMLWVPQQLWNRMAPRSMGVWTVCYHHNRWNQSDIIRFQCELEKYAGQTTSMAAMVKRFASRRRGFDDKIFAARVRFLIWLGRKRRSRMESKMM